MRILILAGFLVLQAGAAMASGDGLELQLGRDDFGLYCAACHGADGRGGGPVADVLSVKPADLTTLSRRAGGKFPEDMVARIIDGREEIKGHGNREMPVWGNYFGAEKEEASQSVREADIEARIKSLVLYLKSIQAP